MLTRQIVGLEGKAVLGRIDRARTAEEAAPRPHVVRPLLRRADSGHHSSRASVVCLDNIGGLWTRNADLAAALKSFTPYLQVPPVLALLMCLLSWPCMPLQKDVSRGLLMLCLMCPHGRLSWQPLAVEVSDGSI